MGGTGLLIYGTLSADRLAPRPVPRTLFDRLAEVSATVAGHWASAWIREELPVVRREILAPFGFTPDDDQAFDWPDRFLPVAALGYLRYLPAEERGGEAAVFEVDYAAVEDVAENTALLAEAGTRYGVWWKTAPAAASSATRPSRRSARSSEILRLRRAEYQVERQEQRLGERIADDRRRDHQCGAAPLQPGPGR